MQEIIGAFSVEKRMGGILGRLGLKQRRSYYLVYHVDDERVTYHREDAPSAPWSRQPDPQVMKCGRDKAVKIFEEIKERARGIGYSVVETVRENQEQIKKIRSVEEIAKFRRESVHGIFLGNDD